MGKARARQLPLTKRNLAVSDAQFKTVGNQKDRGKQTLADLRNYLKEGTRTGQRKKAQAVLEQIRSRFGQAEF